MPAVVVIQCEYLDWFAQVVDTNVKSSSFVKRLLSHFSSGAVACEDAPEASLSNPSSFPDKDDSMLGSQQSCHYITLQGHVPRILYLLVV